jgi:hypothetical protein
MFYSRGLPRGRPISLKGSGVLQDAAPLDGGGLDRLLSRAELELADPEAIRRHETIAYRKLAAPLAGSTHAQPLCSRACRPGRWRFLSRCGGDYF